MKELKPKVVQKYFWIMSAAGALIGLLGVSTGISALSVIGIVVVLMGIIFRLIFYRCPHCGKYLDRSTGEYCPYCREKVNG